MAGWDGLLPLLVTCILGRPTRSRRSTGRFVVDMAARQQEPESSDATQPSDATHVSPDPEPAPAYAAHAQHSATPASPRHLSPTVEKPGAQQVAHLPPVDEPPKLELPWYEDTRSRPGLRRAEQLKRFFRQPPPDNCPDASGWWPR